MKFIKLLVSIFLLMCVAGFAQAYTVVKGDTLGKLAKATGSTVSDIMKLNKGKIKNPNLIYIGRSIELPGTLAESTPEKSVTVAQAEVVHPEIGLEDNVASAQVTPQQVVELATPELQIASAPIVMAVEKPAVVRMQKPATTTLEKFLKRNYPKEVARAFAEMVNNDQFDITETKTRVYSTSREGMDYVLLDHGNGEWAKRVPTPIPPGRYTFSEVVLAPSGPAHVEAGMNPNRIGVRDAIAKLFPESPYKVKNDLLERYRQAEFQPITLHVGDEVPKMLPAEGVVYERVFQAQRFDQPIPAKCFAVTDEESRNNYLLIRDARSGNWYGEIIPPGAENCSRNRIASS